MSSPQPTLVTPLHVPKQHELLDSDQVQVIDHLRIEGIVSKLVSMMPATQRERVVESKHVWFIFVLPHVVSCMKLLNELNQFTKRLRVTY